MLETFCQVRLILWITIGWNGRIPTEQNFTLLNMSTQQFWDECLVYFKQELPTQQFNNWISPLSVDLKEDILFINIPNSFILKVIQERFLGEIVLRSEKHFSKKLK